MNGEWLTLLLAGFMFGAVLWGGGSDSGDDDPDDGGDGSGETLKVDSDATGQITVPNSVDRVEVTAETGASLVQISPFETIFDSESGDAPLEVIGSRQDETFVLSGSGYAVQTVKGADQVEIVGATDVVVTADKFSTVSGPMLADLAEGASYDNTVVIMTGKATYNGGDAGLDNLFVQGSGNVVNGGEGAERVFVDGTRNDILTGAGDDIINTTVSIAQFDNSETDRIDDYVRFSGNRINAGDGNDTIIATWADVITTGDGADDITVFTKAHIEPQDDVHRAVIADFNKAEDTLLIYYDGALEPGGFDMTTEISVDDSFTNTVISGVNGEPLVVLNNVTGLRIGTSNEVGEITTYTDLSGNPVDRADLDVVILRYLETQT